MVQDQRAIGAGSYGQAIEVEHVRGGRFAMKMFFNVDSGRSELAAYRAIKLAAQIAKVSEAACPFLSVQDFCEAPPITWIVFPLIAGGDLWTKMKSRTFERRETAIILHDAWLALCFLHEKAGVLHLDVKPQNMLWTGDKVTIIDFSLWEPWPVPKTRKLSGTYCTPGFRPPELDRKKLQYATQAELRDVVCPAVDWWSLGVTGGYLACAASAEPGKRPHFSPTRWTSSEVRDRHLERVAPLGSGPRLVLDVLLEWEPEARHGSRSLMQYRMGEMLFRSRTWGTW